MYKQNNFKTFVLEKKNLYFCIYTVSLFLKQSLTLLRLAQNLSYSWRPPWSDLPAKGRVIDVH